MADDTFTLEQVREMHRRATSVYATLPDYQQLKRHAPGHVGMLLDLVDQLQAKLDALYVDSGDVMPADRWEHIEAIRERLFDDNGDLRQPGQPSWDLDWLLAEHNRVLVVATHARAAARTTDTVHPLDQYLEASCSN